MKSIYILIAAALLSGCADTTTFIEAMDTDPVGFWHGLWHGMIVTFSWVGSLFMDDIAVYAIYNNGGWYDFGFVLGIGSIAGSARVN